MLNKKHLKYLIVIFFILVILLYIFNNSTKNFFNNLFLLFSTTDINEIGNYIASFGIYAVIVSFLLMMFQSLIAPLPAFLITFANAAIFGWWQGALISWTSSMAGAALCFYISRILGRDVAEKFTNKNLLDKMDGFFNKYGKHTIIILRLLPFISFDYVSYGAGLTSIPFPAFFIATGIGQLPATIIYSYVGDKLTGSSQIFVTGLLTIFAISILFVIVKSYLENKKKMESEIGK